MRKGGKQQSKDEKNKIGNAENRSATTAAGSLTFDRCVRRESRRRGRQTLNIVTYFLGPIGQPTRHQQRATPSPPPTPTIRR